MLMAQSININSVNQIRFTVWNNLQMLMFMEKYGGVSMFYFYDYVHHRLIKLTSLSLNSKSEISLVSLIPKSQNPISESQNLTKIPSKMHYTFNFWRTQVEVIFLPASLAAQVRVFEFWVLWLRPSWPSPSPDLDLNLSLTTFCRYLCREFNNYDKPVSETSYCSAQACWFRSLSIFNYRQENVSSYEYKIMFI